MPDWNLLVENYYKKNRPDKWGRSAIDKLILEMLDEEEEQENNNEDPDYSAATEPETVKWFLDFLRKNGYENVAIEKMVGGDNPRVRLTNLGTKAQRTKIANLVAKAGKDAEQISAGGIGDEYKRLRIGNQIFDLVQGGGGVSAKGADACEVMDSTAFEGNLVYGLLYLSSGEDAAKSYLEQARAQDKGIVCSEVALKAGISAAKSALPKIKEYGLDPSDSKRASGGEIAATLTEPYVTHGAKSTEAKADMIVGGVGCSVKKKEAAQFMSAQGPEMAAVMDVVMNQIATEQKAKLSGEIDEFVNSLQRAIGSEKKAHAKDAETGELKKGAASWYQSKQQLAAATGESDTLFGKLITKAINIDDLDDLTPEEKQQLTIALENTGAESFMDLRESVKDILFDPGFKAAVCKEGITGFGKFNEEAPKAYSMFKWSAADPTNAEFTVFYANGKWDEEWFSKVAARAKLEVRERGKASARGSGTRAEMDKYAVDKDGNRIKESLGLLDEDFSFSEEDMREIELHTEEIYSHFMETQLLQEGAIWDAIKGAASKAKDVASKVWKKIAGFIARAAKYIKNLFQKGFSYLLQAVGLEVTSFEVQY